VEAQDVRPASPFTGTRSVDELSSFVTAAVESCRSRGLNMTPNRRRVLEVVAASSTPLAAYAIIHRLSGTKLLGPPTVYRALEFLIEAGLVRYLALRKAFVLCSRPDESFVTVLTCTACGDTSEKPSEEVWAAIAQFASATGFAPHGRAIEIEGRCASCNGAATDHVF
jgi:Fur family transcriptional regulator, zinc uptake regulator